MYTNDKKFNARCWEMQQSSQHGIKIIKFLGAPKVWPLVPFVLPSSHPVQISQILYSRHYSPNLIPSNNQSLVQNDHLVKYNQGCFSPEFTKCIFFFLGLPGYNSHQLNMVKPSKIVPVIEIHHQKNDTSHYNVSEINGLREK